MQTVTIAGSRDHTRDEAHVVETKPQTMPDLIRARSLDKIVGSVVFGFSGIALTAAMGAYMARAMRLPFAIALTELAIMLLVLVFFFSIIFVSSAIACGKAKTCDRRHGEDEKYHA